jgi:hypothetical protein
LSMTKVIWAAGGRASALRSILQSFPFCALPCAVKIWPRDTASIFVEHSNHGESCQQICAMRSFIQTRGQIYTSNMQYLMLAILPQETVGYVIYSALTGYEGRCSILAIVLRKFFFRKPSHPQNPRMYSVKNMEGTLMDTGSPLCRTYSRNLLTKGEVSPRRKK